MALMQGTHSQHDANKEATSFDRVEQKGTLTGLFDVGVYQERISLRVNVFHHDLEAIETPGLRNLYFITESFEEVLVDDSIRSSKESENMRDEESLVVIETMFPIV